MKGLATNKVSTCNIFSIMIKPSKCSDSNTAVHWTQVFFCDVCGQLKTMRKTSVQIHILFIEYHMECFIFFVHDHAFIWHSQRSNILWRPKKFEKIFHIVLTLSAYLVTSKLSGSIFQKYKISTLKCQNNVEYFFKFSSPLTIYKL